MQWWEHIENCHCTRHPYIDIVCPSKTSYFWERGYDYTIGMHWTTSYFSCFALKYHWMKKKTCFLLYKKESTNSISSSSESEQSTSNSSPCMSNSRTSDFLHLHPCMSNNSRTSDFLSSTVVISVCLLFRHSFRVVNNCLSWSRVHNLFSFI